MRIAINTRFLLEDKLEGIGWFTYETLKRITFDHPEHEFYFFFDRPYSKKFVFEKNVHPVVLFPQARHPFLYYLFFEFAVPLALKKYKIDYFVSTDGFLPLRSEVPSLGVIHDITFEHRPQDVPFLTLKYYRYFFPKFAKKATRIATVSEFSKKDLVDTYHIDPAKIDVVYNGANSNYGPIAESAKKVVRQQYSKGAPYFLYVGSLNPRKNIANLLMAFDRFRSENKTDIKLILVGKVMHNDEHFKKVVASLKHPDEVIFLGRVSSSQLRSILASAFALTYIPFYEGFGIPILEAMYSEIPVITSNVSSLPEVAGDAALLVDPYSVDSITAAMKEISNDETLRIELTGRAVRRKDVFSWDRSASLLWTSIEKMIAESGSNQKEQ